jgi:large subunit ribosomal protein L34
MSFTYKPKKRKRAKTHGFLTRVKTPGGKKVIQKRRRKNRAQIAVPTSKK